MASAIGLTRSPEHSLRGYNFSAVKWRAGATNRSCAATSCSSRSPIASGLPVRRKSRKQPCQAPGRRRRSLSSELKTTRRPPRPSIGRDLKTDQGGGDPPRVVMAHGDHLDRVAVLGTAQTGDQGKPRSVQEAAGNHRGFTQSVERPCGRSGDRARNGWASPRSGHGSGETTTKNILNAGLDVDACVDIARRRIAAPAGPWRWRTRSAMSSTTSARAASPT